MVVNLRLIERPVVRDYGARRTLLLHQIEGGIDELRRFIMDLGTVQDDNPMETFGAALKRHGLDPGGEIMTYAEKLLAEGEARGRMEAQVGNGGRLVAGRGDVGGHQGGHRTDRAGVRDPQDAVVGLRPSLSMTTCRITFRRTSFRLGAPVFLTACPTGRLERATGLSSSRESGR